MRNYLIVLLCSLLCCGCVFTPKKDNSHFYALGFRTLGEQNKTVSDFTASELKIVSLDLEEIPAYSDISQFIELQNKCEIIRLENVRWGEPFKTSITRSLYTSLSKELKNNYTVVLLPGNNNFKESEYKIGVKIVNFIFNKDKNEMCLSAVITIMKHGSLYAICDYNDCFKTGSQDIQVIINSMDWALNMMSSFISHCLGSKVNAFDKQSHGDVVVQTQNSAIETDKPLEVVVANQAQGKVNQEETLIAEHKGKRDIEIVSHGEVYVVVDSEDGNVRYFSGRLFKGSSITVSCDGPFKVISTDNSLIEIH